MKKVICIIIALLTLLTAALADQTVSLPGGFTLTVPDSMVYDGEKGDDSDFCFAYVSEQLEMDVFSYSESRELRELAELLVAQGNDSQLRSVNGIETVTFRGSDPTDGTPFIGYLLKNGDALTEIVLWYATGEAAELCRTIINTLR